MKKWLKWILVAILIIGVLMGAFAAYKSVFAIKMNSEQLEKAQTAVDAGIKIDDPKSDFVDMGGKKEADGRENNLEPYNTEYCDIKSVSANIDEKYFYYKVNFWGKVPNSGPTINGDKIKSCSVKLNLGNKDGVEQGILLTGYNYFLSFSMLKTYYFHGPTGIAEPESARYEGQSYDSLTGGGPGTDYVIGSFPLEKLKIKKGDIVYFDVLIEAESSKFVHASADTLKGSGKLGAVIIWNTSDNSFQIDNEFFNNKKGLIK